VWPLPGLLLLLLLLRVVLGLAPELAPELLTVVWLLLLLPEQPQDQLWCRCRELAGLPLAHEAIALQLLLANSFGSLCRLSRCLSDGPRGKQTINRSNNQADRTALHWVGRSGGRFVVCSHNASIRALNMVSSLRS
jgi:hypothetical protein